MADAAREDQLEWEARASRPAGVAAVGAAVLFLAASPLLNAAFTSRDLDDQLRDLEKSPTEQVVGGAMALVGMILLAGVIYFLYRATKARRSALLSAALALGVVGSLAYGLARLGTSLAYIDLAHDFARAKPPSDLSKISDPDAYLKAVDPLKRANDLARHDILQTLKVVGFATAIATGFSLVMINVNAMRAGLVTRFLGIIGVVVAVLFGVTAGPAPVLTTFWLGAIGALLLNRWPGGRGLAWETGQQEPWPSRAELARAEIARERQEQEDAKGAGGKESSTEAEPEAEPDPDGADPPRQRPSSRKRKRKRR